MELKRIHWHKIKPGQVSAPLILDPTVEEMSKEMKTFEDLEKLTGQRVPVVERAGKATCPRVPRTSLLNVEKENLF